MAYSQNDEERAILSLAEAKGLKNGVFLDIGAYDGKTFSNTLRLAELGWSGICVEPSPSAFVGLMRVHHDHPSIMLLNAAVGTSDSWVYFYDSGGDAVSSSDTNHVLRWSNNAGIKFTKFFLRTVSIHALFRDFGTAFDFINLDVESMNWRIFSEMPWDKLSRVSIVCVEFDSQAQQMIELMAKHGFTLVHRTSENLIFGRA